MRVLLTSLILLSACKRQDDAAPKDAAPKVPVEREGEVVINEVSAANVSLVYDNDGEVSDWLELYNADDHAVDLEGWTLSDDSDEPEMWPLPARVIDPGGFLLVYLSGKNRSLHTNFELRATGERVHLYDATRREVDVMEPGRMWADQSFGRAGDGADVYGYFIDPTPDASNETEVRPGFADRPTFSPAGGFHSAGTAVEVDAADNARVHIATGGENPTEDHPIGQTLTLDGTDIQVFRAVAIEDGLWPSQVATATFLGRDPGVLPIISLVTDPPNLWGSDRGIYVKGDDADWSYPYFGANFWEDWERPVHVSFFEPAGEEGFAIDIGVKIHGGWSRANDQRSLRLTARPSYGEAAIEHEVFPGLGIVEFDNLVLRNSGNDWHGCEESCNAGSHLRDGLMHRLTRGSDIDAMAYRPAEAYINGEYWGLYNIRERPGTAYVAAHHGETDIDLLETGGVATQGDETAYRNLMDTLRSSDLSDPAVYDDIAAQVDIAECADYHLFQIWFGNTDWPGNNIKYWRPRTTDGRWRWFLYDADFGLGMWGESAAHDTLDFALEPDGPWWPNPDWSTEFLRLMVEIPQFRDEFVNRYADRLNTTLRPSETQAVLDEFVAALAPVFPRHVDRWGEPSDDAWEEETENIREWLGERNGYTTDHIVSNFGLAGTWTLDLHADPPGSGTFQLTAVEVEGPFTGTYFLGVPVTVTAVPAPGFTFVGWSDPGLAAAAATLDPGGSLDLTATFQ